MIWLFKKPKIFISQLCWWSYVGIWKIRKFWSPVPLRSFLSCKPGGWSAFLHLSYSPVPYLQSSPKPIGCVSWTSHFCCLFFAPNHGSGRKPVNLCLPRLLIDNYHLTHSSPTSILNYFYPSIMLSVPYSKFFSLNKIRTSFQDASRSNLYPPF